MFGLSLGILGNHWFWVAVISVLALGWMAKEVGKAALGIQGFWKLFR